MGIWDSLVKLIKSDTKDHMIFFDSVLDPWSINEPIPVNYHDIVGFKLEIGV